MKKAVVIVIVLTLLALPLNTVLCVFSTLSIRDGETLADDIEKNRSFIKDGKVTERSALLVQDYVLDVLAAVSKLTFSELEKDEATKLFLSPFITITAKLVKMPYKDKSADEKSEVNLGRIFLLRKKTCNMPYAFIPPLSISFMHSLSPQSFVKLSVTDFLKLRMSFLRCAFRGFADR